MVIVMLRMGWLISQIVGNLVLCLLVDIERDLQFRTLLNGIYTSMIKVTILSNVVIVNIDFLRMIFGPLKYDICLAQILFNDHFVYQIELLFAETFLLRAMYLASWESFGTLNEEFLKVLLDVLNFAISIFFQVIMVMTNDIYKSIRVIMTYLINKSKDYSDFGLFSSWQFAMEFPEVI